jgi:hypothetical protein
VLDGTNPLDAVQVAVAINLPPEEVPWESTPEGTDWLADELRLSSGRGIPRPSRYFPVQQAGHLKSPQRMTTWHHGGYRAPVRQNDLDLRPGYATSVS